MTEIILQKSWLPDGNVHFDLIGKDLPKNFLGLAADVNFNSHFREGDYLGLSLSSGRQPLADQSHWIAMAKAEPGQGKIILGLTQKSDLLASVPDGVLASFTFKNTALEVAGFANQVVSVYENGRKDVQAQWSAQNPSALAAEEVLQTKTEASQQGEVAGGSEGIAQTDAIQQTFEVFPSLMSGGQMEGWGWNWLMPLIFVVLALIAAIVVYRAKRGVRRLVSGEDLRLVQGADFA